MIPDVALQRDRDRVNSDLQKGQAGTGTTLPTTTDTGLETAVADTSNTLTTTTSGQSLQTTNVILSTQGNGSTLTEYVDFVNAGSTLQQRIVVTGIAKTSAKEITKITNYTWNRG